jgi:hypothetical protein
MKLWKQIHHDPVERRTLMRLTISKDAIGHGIQSCSWCGETNGFGGLFLFAWKYLRPWVGLKKGDSRGDSRTLYQVPGVFCSVGCMRDRPRYAHDDLEQMTAYVESSAFKDLVRKHEEEEVNA